MNDINQLARFMIIAGVFLIIIGALIMAFSRFMPLGRLPGDIVIEKKNFKFYFPLATSLIISFILTLIIYLVRWFNK